MLEGVVYWEKSKRGLTNGGLSPKFSEKIGQNQQLRFGVFREGVFQGVISERNFCEICRRKSPQITEKHKTKLFPKGPFFQLLRKVLPGKSGLSDWSLFRAHWGLLGLIGTDSSPPHKAFLGSIGAFWAKPPFAKPPFGFPRV